MAAGQIGHAKFKFYLASRKQKKEVIVTVQHSITATSLFLFF